jgi:hypothetical protein
VPIRFRCAYCNQLMGISRRKLGTVVRCPTCAGQVVVPNPDAPAAPQPPARGTSGKAGPNLFEQSDIDDLLRPGTAAAPPPNEPPSPPPAGAWGTNAEAMLDIERMDAVAVAAPAPPGSSPSQVVIPPPGIVLSTGKMTLLAVIAILLLGIAFGAGVLMGKYVL